MMTLPQVDTINSDMAELPVVLATSLQVTVFQLLVHGIFSCLSGLGFISYGPHVWTRLYCRGATLRNAIIGAPGADGVHCLGSCTIKNVWSEDVGEDALIFKGTSDSVVGLVIGGGARLADDKIIQHNSGGTVTVRVFRAEHFGKVYRSCGNCSHQFKRTVYIEHLYAVASGKNIVGINSDYGTLFAGGDVAHLSNITIQGDSSRKIKICDKYKGNNKGTEPTEIGTGPDSTNCLYQPYDIHYV